MKNSDYIYAFNKVLMPIAYEFAPELVFISAGFDAAEGDPIGGCSVTSEGYAQMTHMLMGLANGKVIIALEGGYKLDSISMAASACTSVLLGASPPALPILTPSKTAIEDVQITCVTQARYWKSIQPKFIDPRKEFQPFDQELVKSDQPVFVKHIKSVSTLVQDHIAQTLKEEYGLIAIQEPDSQMKNRIFASPNYQTSQQPLLIIFYGSVGIQMMSLGSDSSIDPSDAFLTGSVLPYVEMAITKNYQLVLYDSHQRDAAELATLEYLWESVVEVCPAQSKFFIGAPGTENSLFKWIFSTKLDGKIQRVGLILGNRLLPSLPREYQKWLQKNACFYINDNRDVGEWIAYNFFSCGSGSPQSIFWKVRSEVFNHLENPPRGDDFRLHELEDEHENEHRSSKSKSNHHSNGDQGENNENRKHVEEGDGENDDDESEDGDYNDAGGGGFHGFDAVDDDDEYEDELAFHFQHRHRYEEDEDGEDEEEEETEEFYNSELHFLVESDKESDSKKPEKKKDKDLTAELKGIKEPMEIEVQMREPSSQDIRDTENMLNKD